MDEQNSPPPHPPSGSREPDPVLRAAEALLDTVRGMRSALFTGVESDLPAEVWVRLHGFRFESGSGAADQKSGPAPSTARPSAPWPFPFAGTGGPRDRLELLRRLRAEAAPTVLREPPTDTPTDALEIPAAERASPAPDQPESEQPESDLPELELDEPSHPEPEPEPEPEIPELELDEPSHPEPEPEPEPEIPELELDEPSHPEPEPEPLDLDDTPTAEQHLPEREPTVPVRPPSGPQSADDEAAGGVTILDALEEDVESSSDLILPEPAPPDVPEAAERPPERLPPASPKPGGFARRLRNTLAAEEAEIRRPRAVGRGGAGGPQEREQGPDGIGEQRRAWSQERMERASEAVKGDRQLDDFFETGSDSAPPREEPFYDSPTRGETIRHLFDSFSDAPAPPPETADPKEGSQDEWEDVPTTLYDASVMAEALKAARIGGDEHHTGADDDESKSSETEELPPFPGEITDHTGFRLRFDPAIELVDEDEPADHFEGPRLSTGEEGDFVGSLTMDTTLFEGMYEQGSSPWNVDREELQRLETQAKSEMRNGDLRSAINLYSDFLESEPGNADALIERGRCYLDLGDYGAAMSDFLKAQDLDPRDASPLVAMGDLYFARKEYDRAVEYFGQALVLDPEHAMARCRRGISHYHRRRYEEARDDLQAASKLDSDIPNIDQYLNMVVKRLKATR